VPGEDVIIAGGHKRSGFGVSFQAKGLIVIPPDDDEEDED
jgi:hypothetical protein